MKDSSLEIYKEYLEKNGRSKSTIRFYKTVLGELSDFVKAKPFKKITREEIGQYLKWKRGNKRITGKYAHQKGLSESSYPMYILVIKMFYRWLYELPKHHYPEQVADLNPTPVKRQPIQPSEVITKQDIAVLLGSCTNFREKAIIMTLYESACRATEFLNWKIGNLVFDRKGAVLNVSGKTGERRIRLIESVPQLQQWLESHPRRNDKKAYVWTLRGKKRLGYVYLGRLLKRIFGKAGIDKPCNPHAFRHSRLTELAKFLSDAKLKVFAGWVGGSRMSGIYVHLSGADLDDDLLRAAGVEMDGPEPESPLKPKACPRCNFKNLAVVKYCGQCGLPLNPEDMVSREMELEQELTHSRKEYEKVYDIAISMKEELDLRKKEELVRYVASQAPTDTQLKEFLKIRRINGKMLNDDDMQCLEKYNDQWIYNPEEDHLKHGYWVTTKNGI